jgi:hypothetical protein
VALAGTDAAPGATAIARLRDEPSAAPLTALATTSREPFGAALRTAGVTSDPSNIRRAA